MLLVNSFSFGANVYFDYPADESPHYSIQSEGRAVINYRVLRPSSWYLVIGDYEVRITNEDGTWGDWDKGRSGEFKKTKAQSYDFQARVWIISDFSGRRDYWIYSNILTIHVFDNYSPDIPTNLSASWSNDHPLITWSENEEYDMDTYKIQKMVVGETLWGTAAIVSKTITQWVDNNVSPAGKFDPTYTIKYRIRANDINGNSSDYTADASVTGTTDYLWKENIVLDKQEVVDEYALFSNYPNPFNPSTKIEFQIPENSFTSLRVFNALGEQVAELVNNFLGKGQYSVQFQASDLPSGIYLYKLKAGNFTEVKKMILTK